MKGPASTTHTHTHIAPHSPFADAGLRYHTTTLPPRDVTAGITHVIMAFANSSHLVPETAEDYKPFKPLDEVRALFDEGTQVGIAIGGWGDNAGFDIASKSDRSREAWAKNVAKLVEDNGFDFVGGSSP